MKKRILALALAGTTAFSVFGAAMSANAASSHVVYGNDPYVHYQAATVTWTNTAGYVNKAGNFVEDLKDVPATAEAYYNAGNKETVIEKLGYVKIGAADATTIYLHTVYDSAAADAEVLDSYYSYNRIAGANESVATGVLASTVRDGKDVYMAKGDANAEVHFGKDVYDEAIDYINTNLSDELAPAYEPVDQGAVNVYPEYHFNTKSFYGNGELVTEELSRDGVIVENGNVYAYDYFNTAYSVSDFASAWNIANFDRVLNTDKTYAGWLTSVSTKNADLIAALDNLDANGNYTLDNYGYDINLNRGGYNNNRAYVVEQYEEFLYDLGLLTYNGYTLVRTTLTKADFLAAYNYKYNGSDQYNFEELVADIFASVDGTYEFDQVEGVGYEEMSSSNLVYLMQQYDKYVDGSYIDEADNSFGASKWAELLISCLEAVDESEFRSGYSVFARQAAAAIEAYNTAPTKAYQDAAVQALYNVVVNPSGRSAGADKDDLAATLNSLYFNNKNIPTTYMAAVEAKSNNADLVLYGYETAKKVLGFTIGGSTEKTVKAVYPLYPLADYEEDDNTIATYIGNDGKYAGEATDEYEWFVNVYELAAKVNKLNSNASYQGIIDTINDELANSVADLAVTSTPAGSTSLRLEEAVEAYDGKIDTDYIAKYYDAFEKANDYAAAVEGDMQTKYAIEMVITSGDTLGYQSAQTTVTKGDISGLKAAIKDADKALTAIKADKNYNAAQVNALVKAIAGAQAIVDSYNGEVSAYASTVNKKATTTAGDKDSFVKSDVAGALEAIDAAINYSEVVMGWSQKDGKWMYGTDEGYLNNGWNKIGSVWYYFNEDGTAKQSEWYKEGNTWYYFNSNAGAARGWCKVDGEWYYFNDGCAMVTGWRRVDGNWYYMNAGGKMLTGWQTINGKWYYMSKESNSLGQMLSNTTVEGYKLGADGAMIEK